MTRERKATKGNRATKKLKVKTETIRDLNVKGKEKDIKGGGPGDTFLGQSTCMPLCHTK